jgi:hypothetical protein
MTRVYVRDDGKPIGAAYPAKRTTPLGNDSTEVLEKER